MALLRLFVSALLALVLTGSLFSRLSKAVEPAVAGNATWNEVSGRAAAREAISNGERYVVCVGDHLFCVVEVPSADRPLAQLLPRKGLGGGNWRRKDLPIRAAQVEYARAYNAEVIKHVRSGG